MSAFMVNTAHIDAMLTAGLDLSHAGGITLRWWVDDKPRTREGMRELTYETAGMVGAMLLAENQRSVNFRYDEDEVEDPYEFRKVSGYSRSRHALAVIKAVHGYEYQACETEDYWQSEAHAFCEALVGALVRKLPGYRDLETWSIGSPHVFVGT